MNLYGKIIVIKRNGTDGAHFPLTASSCLFGRGLDCDIRIQLPSVENQQCLITIDEKGHVFMKNLSTAAPTLVNDKAVSDSLIALSHGDVITIIDRQFRFEFPANSRFYPKNVPNMKSPRSPKVSVSYQTLKSPRTSGRISTPKPLSPRTDNVPENVTTPKSGKKSPLLSKSPSLTANNNNTNSSIQSTPITLPLTTASFYKETGTPKSLKRLSYVGVTPNTAAQSSVTSPALQGQKNGGSPYPKSNSSLRKSIGDLRRRSMPLFEVQEEDSKIIASVKATKSPLQFYLKRKSVGVVASSIRNSKRVSFGPSLSPEHFDQYLPPKTPVKKGATPSRLTQGRKSLLKRNSPKRNSPRKSSSPRSLSTTANISSPKASSVSKMTMTPTVGSGKKSPSTRASPPSVERNLQSPPLPNDDISSKHISSDNIQSESTDPPGSKPSSPTTITESILQTPTSTPLSLKKGRNSTSSTPSSLKKKIASDSSMNDSIIASQDLFSQMTPIADKVSQDIEPSTTSGVNMIVKSGRARSDGLNEAWLGGRAKVKPLDADRAKSLGSSPLSYSSGKHVKIQALSPLGGKPLKKTPIVKRVGRPRKASDDNQLGKTTGKQTSEVSLVGIRELMKTPKTQVADVSLSGMSFLFKSGNDSTPNVGNKTDTPKPLNQSQFIDTPRPVFSAKRIRTPKTFFDGLVSPPKSKSKTPKSTPTSKRKSLLVAQVPSPAKIASPPQDFNKVVALRAIHGHAITPKLTMQKRGVTPKNTPKSTKKIGSIKKSHVVKTWSDVVKLGVPVSKPVLKSTMTVKASLIKKTIQVKQSGKTPKTPRALARALAPSTGHADSPATIIVGKKALGRGRPKTPMPLPRRGRKNSMSKISRKSTGNTSFTGIVEMFASPPSDKDQNESALYAEIPDTPNGPDEMFVSPLSLSNNGKLRRSVSLSGIRKLFSQKQSQPDVNLVGIKELMKTPKTNDSEISPTGLKRILKTPKNVSVTPTDLKHLFERDESQAKTPGKRGRPSLASKLVSSSGKKGLSPQRNSTPLVSVTGVVASLSNDLTPNRSKRQVHTKSPNLDSNQAVVIKARGQKRKADSRDEPATKRAKMSSTPLKPKASPINAVFTPKGVKNQTNSVESTDSERSDVAQIDPTKKGKGKASLPDTKLSNAASSISPLAAKLKSPGVKQGKLKKNVEFNIVENFVESGLKNKRVRGKVVNTVTQKSPAVSPVKREKSALPSPGAEPSAQLVTSSELEVDVPVVNKTRGKVEKALPVAKSPVTKRKRGRPSLAIATSDREIVSPVVNKTRGKVEKALLVVKSPVTKRKRGQPSIEKAPSTPEIVSPVLNKTRGKVEKALPVAKSPVTKKKRGQPSIEKAASAPEIVSPVVNKTRGKVEQALTMVKSPVAKRKRGQPSIEKAASAPEIVSPVVNKTRGKVEKALTIVKSPVTKRKRGQPSIEKAASAPEIVSPVVNKTRGKVEKALPVAKSPVTKRKRGQPSIEKAASAPEIVSPVVNKTRGKVEKALPVAKSPVTKRKRGQPSIENAPSAPEIVSPVVNKTRGKVEKALPVAKSPVTERKRGQPSLEIATSAPEIVAPVVKGPVTKRKRGRPSLEIATSELDINATKGINSTTGKDDSKEVLKSEKPVTKRKRGRPSLVVTPPGQEVDAVTANAEKSFNPEIISPVVPRKTRGKSTKGGEPVIKKQKLEVESTVVKKTTRGKAGEGSQGRPSQADKLPEGEVDATVVTELRSDELAANPVGKRKIGKVAEISPKVLPRAKRGQAKVKSPLKAKSPISKQGKVKVATRTQTSAQSHQAQDQKPKSKAKVGSPKPTVSTRTRRR